jgi:branched-chain amino acid transport system ATP-binding protein
MHQFPHSAMATDGRAPRLSIAGLDAAYGRVNALRGINIVVETGEVVCLLGRNGAGKTTLIRTICGTLRPTAGAIHFDGELISHLPAAAIVARGIGTVPEGRGVFPSLTVEENLRMGAYAHRKGPWSHADLGEAFAMFPRLRERRRQLAGTLSGGEQQMLAIGRALISRPRLLLLDEPSMGLAPLLVEAIFDTIDALAGQGMTILLVEQNASAALDLADRAYVLEQGRISHAGSAGALQDDPEVRSAYLGLGPDTTHF